jgi:hypothetical protein
MAPIPPYSLQQEEHVVSEGGFHNSKREVFEVEQVEGTVRLFGDDGRVRKIPIPSDDPVDPLTWPSWRRSIVLLSLCVFGTVGFGVIQSTPLFFSQIIQEYEHETRGVSFETRSKSFKATNHSTRHLMRGKSHSLPAIHHCVWE